MGKNNYNNPQVDSTKPTTEVKAPEVDTTVQPEAEVVKSTEEVKTPVTVVTPEVIKEDTSTETEELEVITSLADLYKELHKIDKKSITITLGRCTPSEDADKLFVAELKDINRLLLTDTNEDINKANLRMNALILTILKTKNELRFNILNILFKLDDRRYEPSYLLRIISFTKNATVIQNYAQLISIIETLANPDTRKAKKASVSNFNYLTIDAESKQFLKQYYKI
jgi:hypothetical protein